MSKNMYECEKRKYHYVYLTINLMNEKMYIGKHSTDNLEDGYLGSGTYFNNAVKKYGKENFEKQILFMYDNLQEALDKEKEIITEDVIESEKFYNLKGGGIGGQLSKKTRNNISIALQKSKWRSKLTEEQELALINLHEESRIKNGTLWKKGKEHPKYGKEVSTELRQRISEKLKGNVPVLKGKSYDDFYGEQKSKEIRSKLGRDTSAEKNPCFGRVWLKLNDDKVYPIKNSEEYNDFIKKGYIEDSSVCNTTTGFVWIKNDILRLRTFLVKDSDEYKKMIKLDFIESKGCHLDKNLIGLNKKQREKFLHEQRI